MKCPKCGYLGFETSDRCRNCGYDFSLSVAVEASPELPLQPGSAAAVPLSDLQLGPAQEPSQRNTPSLDLDRLIGVAAEAEVTAVAKPASRAARDTPLMPPRAAPDEPPRVPYPSRDPEAAAEPKDELPLFSPPGREGDDTPLITAPRPVRPPLSVRRATPDVPRGRSRTRVTPPRRDEGTLQLDAPGGSEEATDAGAVATPRATVDLRSSGLVPRTLALAIDGLLLAAIDAGVLYFTLAIAGLSFAELRLLPPIPLAAFLLILDGGYLITFTTAGGQTIGKMLTGIRVMGDDGQRVDTAGAVLRAFGCLITLGTVGLGYLPVFFSADGRALHDRIAGTRVVKGDES